MKSVSSLYDEECEERVWWRVWVACRIKRVSSFLSRLGLFLKVWTVCSVYSCYYQGRGYFLYRQLLQYGIHWHPSQVCWSFEVCGQHSIQTLCHPIILRASTNPLLFSRSPLSPGLSQTFGGTQLFRQLSRRRCNSGRYCSSSGGSGRLASSAGAASLRSQLGRYNMERQFSRQQSRGIDRQKSVMEQQHQGQEKRKNRRLTRQITIADDECHPPAALMGKISQVDTLIEEAEAEEETDGTLIEAEHAETGKVTPISSRLLQL